VDKVWKKIYCHFYFRGITLRRVEKLENVDIEVEFDTYTDDNAKTELDVDTLETKRMIMAPHF